MAVANTPQEKEQSKPIRLHYTFSGQVQGVGFRPHVYRLAHTLGLTGFVQNTPQGVVVEVQGVKASSFAAALAASLPPLASVSSVQEEIIPAINTENSFKIVQTEAGMAHGVLISPDVATCPDCLQDIWDTSNRRYRYPFTNCTACGPRYSIIREMPYDRPSTSMACFPLCPDCAKEYTDPINRRFHAQPNACPICGPQVWFVEDNLPPVQGDAAMGDAAMLKLAEALLAGKIAAIKGLGGFHLACDATNYEAIARLRRAKARPHKPLAIMVQNLNAARQVAHIGPVEESLLLSKERPIVLCPARTDTGEDLGRALLMLAPDTALIGIMLPYTPLHHILLHDFADGRSGLAALVMTSGNRGGEPIAISNREAINRLSGIADVFLLHNRDILIRNDDSVLLPLQDEGGNGFIFLRRGRGYAPLPLPLGNVNNSKGKAILALGAELKNTVCITRNELAFISQHIGDVQNLETAAFQEEIALHLSKALQVEPVEIVCDAHPDFSNSQRLDELRHLLPSVLHNTTLQHHAAHAHAVLGENNISAPALALCLDGTGYGPSGAESRAQSKTKQQGFEAEKIWPEKIWGGELLYVEPNSPSPVRLGAFAPLPLPGGEAAIREPWRIAHALCIKLKLPLDESLCWLPLKAKEAGIIEQMLNKDINSPLTSSAGRFFDAVSALLGICLETTYEGQAAIKLEAAAQSHLNGGKASSHLPLIALDIYSEGSLLRLDTLRLFAELYERKKQGEGAAYLALLFHRSLASGLARLALMGSEQTKTKLVGLSGGVMQNVILRSLLQKELASFGLQAVTHRLLPPSDGCIAYGQAIWAMQQSQ